MESKKHFSDWWHKEGQVEALSETLTKVRIDNSNEDLDSLVKSIKRIRMYDSKFIRPKIRQKKTYIVKLIDNNRDQKNEQ